MRQGPVVHSAKGQGQTLHTVKGRGLVLRQGSIVHSDSGRDKPYTQLRAGINRTNGKVDQQSRQLRAEATEYTVKKAYNLSAGTAGDGKTAKFFYSVDTALSTT